MTTFRGNSGEEICIGERLNLKCNFSSKYVTRIQVGRCVSAHAGHTLFSGKPHFDRKTYPVNPPWVKQSGTGEEHEGPRIRQSRFVEAGPPSSQLMRLIWA